MLQMTELDPTEVGFGGLSNTTVVPRVLSDMVIPAVPGEFYAYSSEFTERRPLYALMKCKANKNRPIEAARFLGREVNLLFLFGDQNQVRVCAVNVAHALGLMGVSVINPFGETQIAITGITPDRFHGLGLRKDVDALVEICRSVRSQHEMFITLESGMVISVMTDGGKYGLFLVRKLGVASISVDACHILL